MDSIENEISGRELRNWENRERIRGLEVVKEEKRGSSVEVNKLEY